MLVGALGALIADNTSYWAGRIGGRTFIERVLKVRLLSRLFSTTHIDRAERYFKTHGGKTVVIGCFAPGLRGPTLLIAGVSRMSYPRFLAYNTVAITIWAVLSAMVGYLFSEYWDELLIASRLVGFALLAIIAFAVALYVYRRRRSAQERFRQLLPLKVRRIEQRPAHRRHGPPRITLVQRHHLRPSSPVS